jgi:hypothetical protein
MPPPFTLEPIKKSENTEALREVLALQRKKLQNEKHNIHVETLKKIHNALLRGEEPVFNNNNKESDNNENGNVWLVENEEYLFNEPPFTPKNSYKVKQMPPTPRKAFNYARLRSSPLTKRRLSYSNNSNNFNNPKQKRPKLNGGKRKTYRRRK